MTSAAPDPIATLRSRRFIGLLILAAILGVPVSAIAYWFLKLVDVTQNWAYTHLPTELGFQAQPIWWPAILLGIAGLLVGSVIRYLPGTGGHSPADGFKAGGIPLSADLPGIALAAFASLALGAVIGPRRSADRARRRTGRVVGTTCQTGCAAASRLSYSRGRQLRRHQHPFGFAAGRSLSPHGGVGTRWSDSDTRPGTWATRGRRGLADLHRTCLLDRIRNVFPCRAEPACVSTPERPGVRLGPARRRGCRTRLLGHPPGRIAGTTRVERRLLLLTPLVGLAIAGLAIGFAEATGKPTSEVLFSGQTALGPLVQNAASYSVGALLLLLACKGFAYSAALAGFRGGPIFPAMFIGAVGGIGLSHLPGLPLVPGVAIGIGAMAAGMLKLPLTSVLLTVLILGNDGITTMPLVILAVVVSFVVTIRLEPAPPAASPANAGAPPGAATAEAQ